MSIIKADDLQKKVGERIAMIKEDFGFTWAQLAQKTSVSERALIAYAKTKRVPTLYHAYKIAINTDTTMNWLIGRGEEDE